MIDEVKIASHYADARADKWGNRRRWNSAYLECYSRVERYTPAELDEALRRIKFKINKLT